MRIVIAFLSLASALLVVACGGGSSQTSKTQPAGSPAAQSTAQTGAPAPSGTPINILGVFSLAGPYGTYGQQANQIAQIAVDEFNAQGGIMGRPVKLTVENDNGDTQVGLSAIQRHLAGGNVDWVLPLFNDLAAGPVLKDAKVMECSYNSNTALANVSDYPHYFNTPNLTSTSSDAMIRYLATSLQAKKVALIYATDFVDSNWATVFQDGIKNTSGIAFSDVESVAADAIDTTPQLIKLRDSNPDVLILAALPPSVGQVLKDIDKIGWNIPIIGDDATASVDLSTLVGDQYLKNMTTLDYAAGVLDQNGQIPAKLQALVNKVKAANGGKVPSPFQGYAMAYDCLQLVKVGIEGAQSTNADAVTTFLTSGKLGSANFLVQPMNFTPDRHFPANTSAFVIATEGKLTDGFLPFKAAIP